MPKARREVAVKMNPTAVKRCIIEIKGHEDIRVSLYTLTTVTDTGGRLLGPGILHHIHSLDIKPALMMVSFILKGHVQSVFRFNLCCRKPYSVIKV